MNFLQIVWLWAILPMLGLLVFLGLWSESRRKRALQRFAGGNVKVVLSPGKRTLRNWLLALALIFLMLAAARPWWGIRPLDLPISSADIPVLFDVSKSMLAQDVAPSRMEHAKWLLKEIIKADPEDRFGLIAFAGRAYFSCPLTSDRVSLEQCIDELSPDLVPIGGTNLAAALATAVQSLEAAKSANRLILLFTDGEELYGDVKKELSLLKDAGVELLIVGLGDPAVPALIPEVGKDSQTKFKRDASGELVKTKLNEPLLKELAQATGGIYVNSNAVQTQLPIIQAKIKAATHSEEHNVQKTLPIEHFMIFLVLGSICFACYLLLSEVPGKNSRKNVKAVLIFLFGACSLMVQATDNNVPLPVNGSEPMTAIQQAPELAAAPEPAETLVQQYNRARSLQLSGDAKQAQTLYETLAGIPQAGDVREASLHNLGILSHTQARQMIQKGVETSRTGSIDGALQELKQAGSALAKAEEYYVNALAESSQATSVADTQTAQQLLLNDREELERLQKELEELKKQQQEAQKQIQQAQQQNQQAQQNQQNQQQQAQQNQQNQQSNGQDSQNNPQEALNQAQKAVDNLKQKAEKIQQKEMEEKAKEAQGALKDAAKKSERKQYQDAAEALKKAQQALAGNENNQDQKQDQKDDSNASNSSDSQKKDDSQSEEQKGETPDKPDQGDEKLPESSSQQQPEEQQEQSMDPKQADAMLDLMAQDEKLLRDAVKNNRNRGIRPVEKDW